MNNESGFTLTELLVGIVVIIILVGVIFMSTLCGMALWKYITV
jgi:type II secretory pathway pseudopilin PulG